jgi:hypothetical protein
MEKSFESKFAKSLSKQSRGRYGNTCMRRNIFIEEKLRIEQKDSVPGLPDRKCQNQKYQFGKILEGLGMEKFV